MPNVNGQSSSVTSQQIPVVPQSQPAIATGIYGRLKSTIGDIILSPMVLIVCVEFFHMPRIK
jgi:hypothetical protein